jgi:2'-5' RNA ligase
MDLQQHYEALYQSSIEKFNKDDYHLDKLIDSPTDKRLGLTVRLRLAQEIKAEVSTVGEQIKQVEPRQYFYPESDMHITVLSIISCYSEFKKSQIEVNQYSNLIQRSLSGIPSFSIQLKGLTASPSCILLKGFPTDNTLDHIRDQLRTHFKSADLEHSIDKRYPIRTAHSTVVRLKEKLNDTQKFLAILEQYKDHDFGTFTADTLELVFNDWYHRKARVQKIQEFRLP